MLSLGVGLMPLVDHIGKLISAFEDKFSEDNLAQPSWTEATVVQGGMIMMGASVNEGPRLTEKAPTASTRRLETGFGKIKKFERTAR